VSRKVQQSPLELVSAEKSACPLCESTMFSDRRLCHPGTGGGSRPQVFAFVQGSPQSDIAASERTPRPNPIHRISNNLPMGW
jgi:hypothetical protein